MQITNNDLFNLKHNLTKIELFKQVNGKSCFLFFFLSLSSFTN